MRYLTFSKMEFEHRAARARELMAGEGIDALLITGEANYYYFSGHRAHAPWSTFTRPLIMVLPRDAPPAILVHVFTEPEARARTWVEEIYTYQVLARAPRRELVDLLKRKGLRKGVIGCETGTEQRLGMPTGDFLAIASDLPEARFRDAGRLIWDIMMRKSQSEIQNLREACRCTSEALHSCLGQVRRGMTEREAVSLLYRAMVDAGAEIPGFAIICSGAQNYQRISGRATDRAFQPGDMVWIDAGALYAGYWSDFCRAAIIGEPSWAQQELQANVHGATMQAISRVRPGVTASWVARECARAMEQYGYEMSFEAGRCGHGLGLLSTEPPHIAPYDHTMLEPGMVITIEPGVVSEHGVFCVEENVLVTETGYEILSGASRELYVVQS